jgi:hypothetical protein
MCNEGMALARSLGEGSLDVRRATREVQRKVLAASARAEEKEKATLHAADGIHPNDLDNSPWRSRSSRAWADRRRLLGARRLPGACLTDARSEVVTARRFTDYSLTSPPDAAVSHEQAKQAEARIEDLQRTLVRPRPFRFLVRSAAPTATWSLNG